MHRFRASLVVAITLALAALPTWAAAASSKKHSSSKAHHARRTAKPAHRVRGQQEIAPERVTQIQQALAGAHYLNQEPNGQWDDTTKNAMQKFQADNGWQTKLLPDARALVKLGLGPDYSGAINAQGSSFAAPPSDTTIPAQQVAGFTSAAGVNR